MRGSSSRRWCCATLHARFTFVRNLITRLAACKFWTTLFVLLRLLPMLTCHSSHNLNPWSPNVPHIRLDLPQSAKCILNKHLGECIDKTILLKRFRGMKIYFVTSASTAINYFIMLSAAGSISTQWPFKNLYYHFTKTLMIIWSSDFNHIKHSSNDTLIHTTPFKKGNGILLPTWVSKKFSKLAVFTVVSNLNWIFSFKLSASVTSDYLFKFVFSEKCCWYWSNVKWLFKQIDSGH